LESARCAKVLVDAGGEQERVGGWEWEPWEVLGRRLRLVGRLYVFGSERSFKVGVLRILSGRRTVSEYIAMRGTTCWEGSGSEAEVVWGDVEGRRRAVGS
jgi:hypothetical protein